VVKSGQDFAAGVVGVDLDVVVHAVGGVKAIDGFVAAQYLQGACHVRLCPRIIVQVALFNALAICLKLNPRSK
jgi:hypothetical protein